MKRNRKPRSYPNAVNPPKFANTISPPLSSPSLFDLGHTDRIIRNEINRRVQRKIHSGSFGMDAQLLFDDLQLSPSRIQGIEKLLRIATDQKVVSHTVQSEIRGAIKNYQHWKKGPGKQTKHELRKKIKNKVLSFEIALNLAISNPDSELFQSYLNTVYYCQSMYTQDGYKITSKYCNNRHCYSCNRIRAGKLMNNYSPFIDWMGEDTYFVTLTIPNVSGDELRSSIEQMKSVFRLIKDNLRKQKLKLTGLRKMECTYNLDTKKFHPHFHFLVKGQPQAEALHREWFAYWPNLSEDAQDIEIADEGSKKELFKYFTKFWGKEIDFQAQDIILRSIRGMRIFQPFGMEDYKRETSQEVDESEEIETTQHSLFNVQPRDEQFYYNPETFNFFAPSTGEEIISFKLPIKTEKLIQHLNEAMKEPQRRARDEFIDPFRKMISEKIGFDTDDLSSFWKMISDKGG